MPKQDVITMAVQCRIADGVYSFMMDQKQYNFPEYLEVQKTDRIAYLLLQDGVSTKKLGLVPEDAILVSADKGTVIFYSPTEKESAKASKALRREIRQGLTCPYCYKSTELVDSKIFYGRSYGMVWACIPCNAWVGTHENSGQHKALGRLANAELREWKKRAHNSFDPLWKEKVSAGADRQTERNKAYGWLAKWMNINRNYCHIGMFDVEQCKTVVKICKQYGGSY